MKLYCFVFPNFIYSFILGNDILLTFETKVSTRDYSICYSKNYATMDYGSITEANS